MAQINNLVSLAPGCPIKLTNLAQVSAAGQSLRFTVPPRPGGGEFSLTLQIVGSPSGLTSSIQADMSSGSAGTNLANYVATGPTAAGIFIVGTASTNPIVGGLLYSFNVGALTSGTFDVYATIN